MPTWITCACIDCGAETKRQPASIAKRKEARCKPCAGKFNAANRGCDNRSFLPEYRVWSSMLARCNTPTHQVYERYGGRGITVCKRWHSFDKFYADMGPRPSTEHSLERKNNDKGYKPSNCCWATAKEQNRNTRANVYYEVNGERKLLCDWAAALGTRREVLFHRIQYYGWSVEKACTTPVAPRTKRR